MQEDKGRGRGRGRGRGLRQSKTPTTPNVSTTSATSKLVAPETSARSRKPVIGSVSTQVTELKLTSSQPVPLQSRPTHLQLTQTTYSKPGQSSQIFEQGVQGDKQNRSEGAGYSSRVGAERDSSIGRGAIRGRRSICTDSLIVTKPENLPTKKGVTGNQILLQSNYFKLPSITTWVLYQYRVDFSPEEDSLYIRKKLLRLHNKTLGAYIFDGTMLFTSNRLQDRIELLSIKESDNTKIQIIVKLIGEVPRNHFYYLQFFNLIMKKCLEFLNLQLVGRNYYDAHSKVDVSQFKLELWPGYFTSIREHESNILMCAEITHKVMRQETLLDLWYICLKEEKKPQEVFSDLVRGTIVLTDYNNNTYSIQDVDFKLRPNCTFKLKSGEMISYKDYYKNRYEIKIRDGDQPLLIAKPKQKIRSINTPLDQMIYLVPELCRATGLTEKMRADRNLMKTLSVYTRVSPKARVNKLLQFNRRLCSEQKVMTELKSWNLQLENKLIEIPGRVLPYEKIVFHSRSVSAGAEADWKGYFRNNKMVYCNCLDNWILIHTSNTRADCESFLKNLIKVAEGMGFIIKRPEMITIRNDRIDSYLEAIENYLSRRNTKLVFCVLPYVRTDRYNAIKKKCCLDRPVPSQVMIQRNLTKGLSVATKVAIQINCKLGGVPWYVEIPLPDLMVVGFDVCHSKKSTNFGAVVATLDKNLSRYISAVSPHNYGQELSNDIATHICKFIEVYQKYNKKFPTRIVIYRDGVGEGQIEQVYEHEVKEIREKLEKLYAGEQVKMAFIIVNKNVKTRFFYHEANNPPCGTIVDDVITSPVKYDFFIVSQHVTEGTVTPTSYSVIDDNVGLNADKMQRLTYKLTHMYYNWTGTVRVPAPCQYAHKLAYLCTESIEEVPNLQLEHLLYYL